MGRSWAHCSLWRLVPVLARPAVLMMDLSRGCWLSDLPVVCVYQQRHQHLPRTQQSLDKTLSKARSLTHQVPSYASTSGAAETGFTP